MVDYNIDIPINISICALGGIPITKLIRWEGIDYSTLQVYLLYWQQIAYIILSDNAIIVREINFIKFLGLSCKRNY